MFGFLKKLYQTDPEKEQQRKEKKEKLPLEKARKKHSKRVADKQLLDDEWHPTDLPYQVTIFNIQRANKGYGSTCQISVRYIENEQYKDMIYLVNPKVKSFSFSNYHDIKPEDVADAPSFKDVWPKIEPYFVGKNVITYYADAHLKTLKATLKKNHIPEPEMHFIDLYDYFCERHEGWASHSLDFVSEKLELSACPDPMHAQSTLSTITDILEMLQNEHPKVMKKLLDTADKID